MVPVTSVHTKPSAETSEGGIGRSGRDRIGRGMNKIEGQKRLRKRNFKG